MKRIYIAGCGGMLGDAFYKQFNNNYELKCTDIDVNENWLSYLDFRSFTNYRDDVIKFDSQYLFHLGAFTDLEYCELHPKDIYETNTQSVEHGVKIANELNIPILFISTVGIFNGKKIFMMKMILLTLWDIMLNLSISQKNLYKIMQKNT